LGHSATFAYNAGDLLTSTTDRNGKVRNLSYDALNRKTGETWVVSGSTVNTQTFTYDAADNQLTAQDQSGAYTMAYDTLNRMTSEQEPFGQALTFSYDAASNRTQAQDSQSGVTTSVYDALGRLTSRKFSNGTTNLRIDPGWTSRDQLASLKRYTDLGGTSLVGMSSYTYDSAMRLTALTHTYASGSVLASYAYGYDQASRLTSETVNGTQTTYAYDNTDQLTTVNGVATYSYDLNGNRTMTGYATGSANEMTNDGTFTYTYDSEGNLTQKSKGTNLETWYYGYDSLNRLTSVRKTSDGTTNQVTATYTYDVYGDRIEQDEWVKPGSGNGVTTVTRFAYDGTNVWADLNSSNALTMRRLYLDGVDQPFARIDSNNVAAWYLTDHLGSVRDVMDKAGATDLDHIVYDAYGNITSESSTTSGDRYKYTGREWDGNTGLQYNRARYYDPKTGRWFAQDPLGFAASDSNLYRYVHNAPMTNIDPSGLQEPTIEKPTVTPLWVNDVAGELDNEFIRKRTKLDRPRMKDSSFCFDDRLKKVKLPELDFTILEDKIVYGWDFAGVRIKVPKFTGTVRQKVVKTITEYDANGNVIGTPKVTHLGEFFFIKNGVSIKPDAHYTGLRFDLATKTRKMVVVAEFELGAVTEKKFMLPNNGSRPYVTGTERPDEGPAFTWPGAATLKYKRTITLDATVDPPEITGKYEIP
jgi:RHS repeat-associated protein